LPLHKLLWPIPLLLSKFYKQCVGRSWHRSKTGALAPNHDQVAKLKCPKGLDVYPKLLYISMNNPRSAPRCMLKFPQNNGSRLRACCFRHWSKLAIWDNNPPPKLGPYHQCFWHIWISKYSSMDILLILPISTRIWL